MIFGEYEVTGPREYRGHKHGEKFIARLDRGAEARAIGRGAIRFICTFEPALEPGSYELPKGWATSHIEAHPDVTDTPAKSAGTSEDGTRQSAAHRLQREHGHGVHEVDFAVGQDPDRRDRRKQQL